MSRLGRLARLAFEAPFNIPLHAKRVAFGPILRFRLRASGVRLGRDVRLFGSPIVRRWRGSRISIGAECELRSSARSNVLGLSHPVVLTTVRAGACIDIRAGCGLSGTTICAADSITVGSGCLIGADVLITDNDHHALVATERLKNSLDGVSVAPVVIGPNVFIGARAIVLKGSTIGDNAVIGAGSVVAGPVPANAIVAGNPARVVGQVNMR